MKKYCLILFTVGLMLISFNTLGNQKINAKTNVEQAVGNSISLHTGLIIVDEA